MHAATALIVVIVANLFEHVGAVSKRWCCLTELDLMPNAYNVGYGECPGGLLYYTSRPPSGPWPTDLDTLLLVFTTVLTNLCFVPGVINNARRGMAFEMVVGAATFVTSTLYHLSEVMDRRVLDMNPGQWHRLDNVFAIMSLVAVVGLWMDLPPGYHRDALRWGAMVMVVCFQELGPWSLLCTLIPIITSLLVFAWFLLTNPTHWRLYNRNMTRGLLAMALAFVCFFKGLDEQRDAYRAFHGCWHVFMGTAVYFFTRGCVTRPTTTTSGAEVRKEK